MKRSQTEENFALDLVAMAMEHCCLPCGHRSDAAHMQLALWVVEEKAKNKALRDELVARDLKTIPDSM